MESGKLTYFYREDNKPLKSHLFRLKLKGDRKKEETTSREKSEKNLKRKSREKIFLSPIFFYSLFSVFREIKKKIKIRRKRPPHGYTRPCLPYPRAANNAGKFCKSFPKNKSFQRIFPLKMIVITANVIQLSVYKHRGKCCFASSFPSTPRPPTVTSLLPSSFPVGSFSSKNGRRDPLRQHPFKIWQIILFSRWCRT